MGLKKTVSSSNETSVPSSEVGEPVITAGSTEHCRGGGVLVRVSPLSCRYSELCRRRAGNGPYSSWRGVPEDGGSEPVSREVRPCSSNARYWSAMRSTLEALPGAWLGLGIPSSCPIEKTGVFARRLIFEVEEVGGLEQVDSCAGVLFVSGCENLGMMRAGLLGGVGGSRERWAWT